MEEKTPCIICANSAIQFKEYRGLDKSNQYLADLFYDKNLFRCETCNHYFCYPEIDNRDLNRIYLSYYWKRVKGKSKNLKNLLKDFLVKYLATSIKTINPRARNGVYS